MPLRRLGEAVAARTDRDSEGDDACDDAAMLACNDMGWHGRAMEPCPVVGLGAWDDAAGNDGAGGDGAPDAPRDQWSCALVPRLEARARQLQRALTSFHVTIATWRAVPLTPSDLSRLLLSLAAHCPSLQRCVLQVKVSGETGWRGDRGGHATCEEEAETGEEAEAEAEAGSAYSRGARRMGNSVCAALRALLTQCSALRSLHLHHTSLTPHLCLPASLPALAPRLEHLSLPLPSIPPCLFRLSSLRSLSFTLSPPIQPQLASGSPFSHMTRLSSLSLHLDLDVHVHRDPPPHLFLRMLLSHCHPACIPPSTLPISPDLFAGLGPSLRRLSLRSTKVRGFCEDWPPVRVPREHCLASLWSLHSLTQLDTNLWVMDGDWGEQEVQESLGQGSEERSRDVDEDEDEDEKEMRSWRRERYEPGAGDPWDRNRGPGPFSLYRPHSTLGPCLAALCSLTSLTLSLHSVVPAALSQLSSLTRLEMPAAAFDPHGVILSLPTLRHLDVAIPDLSLLLPSHEPSPRTDATSSVGASSSRLSTTVTLGTAALTPTGAHATDTTTTSSSSLSSTTGLHTLVLRSTDRLLIPPTTSPYPSLLHLELHSLPSLLWLGPHDRPMPPSCCLFPNLRSLLCAVNSSRGGMEVDVAALPSLTHMSGGPCLLRTDTTPPLYPRLQFLLLKFTEPPYPAPLSSFTQLRFLCLGMAGLPWQTALLPALSSLPLLRTLRLENIYTAMQCCVFDKPLPLTTLQLCNAHLESLHPSIALLTRLTRLDLLRWIHLKCLPEQLTALTALQSLAVSGCQRGRPGVPGCYLSATQQRFPLLGTSPRDSPSLSTREPCVFELLVHAGSEAPRARDGEPCRGQGGGRGAASRLKNIARVPVARSPQHH
ncbi:unnamed protein product [Closterium sp. Naga37s-1]|nr:unnamed protein product [Closterium sp. Naga37s-1]